MQSLDSEVARELEEALDIDLSGGARSGDLDIAASMEDLEAQIAQAADELARESKTNPPKAAAQQSPAQQAPAQQAAAAAPAIEDVVSGGRRKSWTAPTAIRTMLPTNGSSQFPVRSMR